ncbi:MAG: LuxR C-terminal-related transcriptional regulator [Culturomica sp.]|nr:LuxR C-terminal-related transcriptional regulator [Culturomica sp.]
MNRVCFSANVKMADLLIANGKLLYLLPNFGIELGFGEKTVAQVCEEYGVPEPLFLLICNLYTFDDYTPDHAELKQVSIEDVVVYLQNSHKSYLETSMPQTLEKVLSLAELHVQPANKNMLVAFCDKYRQEAIAHIKYEEEVVFSHIRMLLAGEKSNYVVSEFENSHKNIDTTLKDLRSIIIKYAPRTCTIAQCLPVLIDLFMLEYDLRKHTRLENFVLIPLIEYLNDGGHNGYDSSDLSERERQTLAALARGLSNKEIAEKLNISIHTVISHRKNIVRKTGIKTAQGLTLYAFINNLITPKDLR